MQHDRDPSLVKKAAIKIAISSFLIQVLTLYSSELFNSVFNNAFDAQALDLAGRLPNVFKPLAFVVFLGAYAFQLAMVLATLKPMASYLAEGRDYSRARLAAIKLPWRIVFIQTGTWMLGTTAFYLMANWAPADGIPFGLNLLLKLSFGFVGSMYNCILINIHLLPAKRVMGITEIKAGENDIFTRYKNLFIVFCSAFFIVIHFVYLSYYLVEPHRLASSFYLLVGLWGLYFVALSLGLAFASRFEYNTQIRYLKDRIGALLESSSQASTERVELLYFDEIGEFAALFNRFLEKFQALLDEIVSSALVLTSAVQELSTTTKEVSSTSNMQAAAVKEVVSTMEDSNVITRAIGGSITEVSRIAMKTKERSDSGSGIVQSTMDKMSEIRKKNTDTIAGIRSLTDKIRAIWGIVDIINSIVEQTRIIAFNASLEASTAGEAGKNFRIVADEIKRLADSTSRSTAEIQARITEIQKAANNLIVVSEEGTERIRQGHEMSERLHEVFSEILSSADISASSSQSIERSIRQQAVAFEQILITMKEISSGIDNVVVTQSQNAHTAESLRAMATKLDGEARVFIGEAAKEEA